MSLPASVSIGALPAGCQPFGHGFWCPAGSIEGHDKTTYTVSGTPTSTGDVTISAGYGQDGQTGFTNQSPVTISVTAASAPPTPAASP